MWETEKSWVAGIKKKNILTNPQISLYCTENLNDLEVEHKKNLNKNTIDKTIRLFILSR